MLMSARHAYLRPHHQPDARGRVVAPRWPASTVWQSSNSCRRVHAASMNWSTRSVPLNRSCRSTSASSAVLAWFEPNGVGREVAYSLADDHVAHIVADAVEPHPSKENLTMIALEQARAATLPTDLVVHVLTRTGSPWSAIWRGGPRARGRPHRHRLARLRHARPRARDDRGQGRESRGSIGARREAVTIARDQTVASREDHFPS